MRRFAVMAAFAPQAAIRVAGGLFGLVVTIGDIGFGVVLFDPSDDVLGVQRNAIARRNPKGAQFADDQAHAVGQEVLQRRIGHLTQHAG